MQFLAPAARGCVGAAAGVWGERAGGFPSAPTSAPGSFEGVPGQKPGRGRQSPRCLAAATRVRAGTAASPRCPRSDGAAGKTPSQVPVPHLPRRGGGGERLGTPLRGKSLVM